MIDVKRDTAGLESVARRIRREAVLAVAHAKGGHLGGPMSAADILAALYFDVMNIRPAEPQWHRDRFVLSKGHSCIALYGHSLFAGTSRSRSSPLSTRSTRDSRVTRT